MKLIIDKLKTRISPIFKNGEKDKMFFHSSQKGRKR